MAFFFGPDKQADGAEDRRSTFGIEGLPEEILIPITSGAFVRGIAETFEIFGLPAVFLDRGAHVLFANRAAVAVLTGPLRVRANHLVAERREDNRVLSDLIAQAMNDGGDGMRSAVLPRAKLSLHLLPVGDHLASTGQMLSAVAIIDSGDDPGVASMIGRIDAMSPKAACASAKLQETG